VSAEPVIDLDEYGEPVRDHYKRMGAGAERSDEEGLYVRFAPGFGLNVHIGWRRGLYNPPRSFISRGRPDRYEDGDELAMSIKGWEALGLMVDEWRAREAARGSKGEKT